MLVVDIDLGLECLGLEGGGGRHYRLVRKALLRRFQIDDIAFDVLSFEHRAAALAMLDGEQAHAQSGAIGGRRHHEIHVPDQPSSRMTSPGTTDSSLACVNSSPPPPICGNSGGTL